MVVLHSRSGQFRSKSPAKEPAFVSDQVSQARRYYLNLKPLESVPLIVVCGGVEKMRWDYVVSRDLFPYFAIEMVTEGRGELTLAGNAFSLSPGMIFAYGPTTPHRIANHSSQRMRKFYVDFVGRDAERVLIETGLMAGQPLRVTRMHELIELIEQSVYPMCAESLQQ